MAVPNTIQIQVARTQAEKMLTESATHYIRSDAIQSSGSQKATWAAQGTALPCLVYMGVSGKKIQSEKGLIGASEADTGTHTIRFKYNAGVTVGDKVVVGTSTFHIIADGDSDTNRILLSVGAVRVR